jgi:hypothetical protein
VAGVADARIKRLVAGLKERGYESVYLDRLEQRLDVEAAHEVLEQEIVAEMAAALGRSAAKVDLALLHLELADRELEAAEDADERARLVARFNVLRAEALRARHELAIHREAVGFRRNHELERVYPIPRPRR